MSELKGQWFGGDQMIVLMKMKVILVDYTYKQMISFSVLSRYFRFVYSAALHVLKRAREKEIAGRPFAFLKVSCCPTNTKQQQQ